LLSLLASEEANRRKKTIRAAQKSLMLWDPRKGSRKPPKESADLIFSVGELFDLPRTFQRSEEPDFLLMTIGSTTRGAIERAYDWLIPIISYVPDTISRLPASASCFLLLRAYGTEGEERAQLQELSAPLLVHVRDSLMGKFGEADAVRAFDLLLTDVASHNPDRRQCARRVLHDAIGKEETGESDSTFAKSKCAWMINMLHVEHVTSIISEAIKHMVRTLLAFAVFHLPSFLITPKARAASFERGRVLRFLVLSLDKLTNFAKNKEIPGEWNFASMLIGLISSRPTVFAATMGSFPDLRSLAIRVVHDEFNKYTDIPSDDNAKADVEYACEITLCCKPSSDSNGETVTAFLPLYLLQSSCVLLSIWLDGDNYDEDSRAVDSLVKMLMRPQEVDDGDESEENEKIDGLASARLAETGKSAIPVESVSFIFAMTD
jgi:integrator complex subunit 1